MRRVLSPNIKMVADTFVVHDCRDALGLLDAITFPRALSDDERDLDAPNRFERVVIFQIRQVIHRVLEVEALVIVTVQALANVEISGQAKDVAEVPRVLQCKVQRMIRTEA